MKRPVPLERGRKAAVYRAFQKMRLRSPSRRGAYSALRRIEKFDADGSQINE
jgi:hypothetical protein